MNTLTRARGWNRFLWVAGAAHFALFYTLNTRPMLDIALFTEGRERIPFQYRALTAGVFLLADKLPRFPAALQKRLPPSMSRPDEFAMLAIAFVSVLVAVYATRRALERLRCGAEASRWWALLVIFMGYYHYLLEFGHPCCTPLQLPYDLPSMTFFALGMWAIAAESDWVLYPLVVAGMVNRESVVFLVGIYLLYSLGLWRSGSRSRERLLKATIHGAVLGAVCLAVMATLHRSFPNAAPQFATLGPFENHVADNIGYLLRPYYWTSYLSLFGFSWLYVYANWRSVPHAGIRWALGIGPMMLVAMYVVGVLSEIRIFGELISLFTIAVALLLTQALASAERDGSLQSGIHTGS